MEDILSSIRRVIARDEAPGAAREHRASDDVLDLHEEDIGAADDEAAIPAPAASDDLVSSASADAARQSLEALTAAVAPVVAAAAATAAPASARTMEDVVMEALRPMLKQWLDTNLPDIVEAMVAREISRITGRRL